MDVVLHGPFRLKTIRNRAKNIPKLRNVWIRRLEEDAISVATERERARYYWRGFILFKDFQGGRRSFTVLKTVIDYSGSFVHYKGALEYDIITHGAACRVSVSISQSQKCFSVEFQYVIMKVLESASSYFCA